jgi:hypothetical protein
MRTTDSAHLVLHRVLALTIYARGAHNAACARHWCNSGELPVKIVLGSLHACLADREQRVKRFCKERRLISSVKERIAVGWTEIRSHQMGENTSLYECVALARVASYSAATESRVTGHPLYTQE